MSRVPYSPKVKVDSTATMISLIKAIRDNTKINKELIGLQKDQIKESKLVREEIASLSNEVAILRSDMTQLREVLGHERRNNIRGNGA